MPHDHPPGMPPDDPISTTDSDRRLYVPYPDEWAARVKVGWDKDYCFAKNPGEEFFHLLMNGEVYLQRGDEKLCLNCALRQRILTDDRLYWQRRPDRPPSAEVGL